MQMRGWLRAILGREGRVEEVVPGSKLRLAHSSSRALSEGLTGPFGLDRFASKARLVSCGPQIWDTLQILWE